MSTVSVALVDHQDSRADVSSRHLTRQMTVVYRVDAVAQAVRRPVLTGDPVRPLPVVHVEREFRRCLTCGILAHGFARARCGQCGHDFLIACSCKGRGVGPTRAGCGQLTDVCAPATHCLRDRPGNLPRHRVDGASLALDPCLTGITKLEILGVGRLNFLSFETPIRSTGPTLNPVNNASKYFTRPDARGCSSGCFRHDFPAMPR